MERDGEIRPSKMMMTLRTSAFVLLAGCAGSGTITLPAFDRDAIVRAYPAIKLYRAPEVPEAKGAGEAWSGGGNTVIPAGAHVRMDLDDGGGAKRTEYDLGSDGAIEPYPGVRTRVAGRTIAEAQGDLERDLRRFYRNPRVTLAVRAAEARPEKTRHAYDICGRVKKPGSTSSEIPLRSSLAFARAGGFDGDVAVNQLLVMRYAGAALDRVIVCNYINIVEQNAAGEDLWLQDGDVVFAPGLEGPPWDLIAEASAGRLDRAGLIRALNAR